jgi:phage terminase large subunit-like protein
VERAQPLAAQAEAGTVKIVEGNWNRDYLDELCSFPEGKADQVDASSAAFNRLNNAKKKFWMAV